MRRLSLGIGLIATLLLGPMGAGITTVAAQEAPEIDLPHVRDPADCQGASRSTDELIALWYSPELSPVSEPSSDEDGATTDVTIPVGSAVDEATRAAVIATVVGNFSCSAAGDYLRASTHYSDSFIQAQSPAEVASEDEIRALLDAEPNPDTANAPAQILAVTDVMKLTDGRVGAFVVTENGAQTEVSYVMLVENAGRWLLDELIDFGE